MSINLDRPAGETGCADTRLEANFMLEFINFRPIERKARINPISMSTSTLCERSPLWFNLGHPTTEN